MKTSNTEYPIQLQYVNRGVVCPKVAGVEMPDFEEFEKVYVLFDGKEGGHYINALCVFHKDILRNAYNIMGFQAQTWPYDKEDALFNYPYWSLTHITDYVNNFTFTTLKDTEPIYWGEIIQVIEYNTKVPMPY